MAELTTTYQAHYKAMQSHDAGVMAFPPLLKQPAMGRPQVAVGAVSHGRMTVRGRFRSDSNGFAHYLRFACGRRTHRWVKFRVAGGHRPPYRCMGSNAESFR